MALVAAVAAAAVALSIPQARTLAGLEFGTEIRSGDCGLDIALASRGADAAAGTYAVTWIGSRDGYPLMELRLQVSTGDGRERHFPLAALQRFDYANISYDDRTGSADELNEGDAFRINESQGADLILRTMAGKRIGGTGGCV